MIRKPKPRVRPSPVINFQDYTQAMTPLDRYRKHLALFDYWNAQLLEELQQRTMNPKRARLASSESLQELQILQGLVQDEIATHVEPVLEERTQIDGQIQRGSYTPSQLDGIRRTLERQTRQIQRELFWRRVEDRLKDKAAANATSD